MEKLGLKQVELWKMIPWRIKAIKHHQKIRNLVHVYMEKKSNKNIFTLRNARISTAAALPNFLPPQSHAQLLKPTLGTRLL